MKYMCTWVKNSVGLRIKCMLLSAISVNLVPSFHLSLHEIFKYGIFWQVQCSWLQLYVSNITECKLEGGKKKKELSPWLNVTNKQGSWHHRKMTPQKILTQCPTSMSPRAGAESTRTYFFDTDTQTYICAQNMSLQIDFS